MLRSLWQVLNQRRKEPLHNFNATDSTTTSLGKKGEDVVADYLQQKGYAILAQNYRSKLGEIDIIARKNETLAFVEVKLRKNPYFPMTQLITPSKQKKIIKTAEIYRAKKGIINANFRFDIALVTLPNTQPSITYIDNAFTASDI